MEGKPKTPRLFFFLPPKGIDFTRIESNEMKSPCTESFLSLESSVLTLESRVFERKRKGEVGKGEGGLILSARHVITL